MDEEDRDQLRCAAVVIEARDAIVSAVGDLAAAPLSEAAAIAPRRPPPPILDTTQEEPMVNYVFISPTFPETAAIFCEHLAAAGVRVFGIGDSWEVSDRLRSCLTEYYRVDSLHDYDAVHRAVAWLTWKYGRMDWIESNNEYWLGLDAALRTDFNVPTGFHTDVLDSVKSKAAMKEVYARAGIPTARQSTVTTLEAARAFIDIVGYPAFMKPEYGVGALSTFRLDGDDDLTAAMAALPAEPYVLEEYITGDIYSYDAILDAHGNPRWEIATHWPESIAKIVETGSDLSYRVEAQMPVQLRGYGRRTARAFGMANRFVHLEFFRLAAAKPGLGGPGDFVALEANMRHAGGYTVDMYDYAGDCDVYQIYTDVVTGTDTGAALRATQHRQLCVYGGRRDVISYVMPREQLLDKYAGELVRTGRNPDVFRAQMCDEFFMIRTPSTDRADEFASDVCTRA